MISPSVSNQFTFKHLSRREPQMLTSAVPTVRTRPIEAAFQSELFWGCVSKVPSQLPNPGRPASKAIQSVLPRPEPVPDSRASKLTARRRSHRLLHSARNGSYRFCRGKGRDACERITSDQMATRTCAESALVRPIGPLLQLRSPLQIKLPRARRSASETEPDMAS